jgi:hypothetical protein
MEPDKSTSSEMIENIEINLCNLSLKAGRMDRKDFRAFLYVAAFVLIVVVIGAVFVVKYMAPTLGNLAYAAGGGVAGSFGRKLLGKINSNKP